MATHLAAPTSGGADRTSSRLWRHILDSTLEEDAHEVDRVWGARATEGGGHLRGTQEEGITGPFPIR